MFNKLLFLLNMPYFMLFWVAKLPPSPFYCHPLTSKRISKSCQPPSCFKTTPSSDFKICLEKVYVPSIPPDITPLPPPLVRYMRVRRKQPNKIVGDIK